VPEPLLFGSCIAWVISRKDLNSRTDLRFAANGHLYDIEDYAVEVHGIRPHRD
jgi:hypothetical protein